MKIIRTSVGGVMRSPKCIIVMHAEPDEKKGVQKYGHAPPDAPADDTLLPTNVDEAGMYGYRDATPDNKDGNVTASNTTAPAIYGYGDATPDSKHQQTYSGPRSCSPRGSTAGPASRRSSLKGSVNSVGTLRRRESIGQTGGGEEIEVHLPCNHQPVIRRRSITFNEGVMVRKVRPTKSLTDQPEALWLQDDEMDRIKQQISDLVQEKARYVETHDACDSSVEDDEEGVAAECTRGLERMLEPERTKVKKFQAWDLVMNEQYLQRQEGEFDDESLAVMYGYTTRRSQREAQQRASNDEEEIKGYLRSTRRMCRRLSM